MYEFNRSAPSFYEKKMGIIKELLKKIRRRALKSGYACDSCGKELFDYPVHRLCVDCEGKLLLPKRPCPKCGRERIADGLCMDCKYSPPKFTQGISPFLYRGEVASLINRMKNGYPRLAAYFGEQMAKCFLERVRERDALLIVAVPMTKSREIERGYNQAERLAESMETYFTEKGFSVELNFSLLEKTKETKLQKRASVRERAENVQGAFRLRKRKVFEGRTVLLVDDIMTTGATGNECAQKIVNAGAKAVYFLTATAVPENK